MKRLISLWIGALLLLHRWTIVTGLLMILVTVCVLIRLYLAQMQEILLEEAEEKAEELAEKRFNEMVDHTEYRVSFRQYVGLGKGFDNESNQDHRRCQRS